jgi:sugar lactone lactonase YvrE
MTGLRMEFAIEPVGDVNAILGEGPYWDESRKILLWVDIPGGMFHRTDPATGQTVTEDIGVPVSAAFPVEGGGTLLARKAALVLQRDGEADRVVARTADAEDIRFNDASVDPRGRVWVGSMDIGEAAASGQLYRLDPGGVLTALVTGVTVSNGIGWSPDEHLMYYADSPTRRVDVFDYDSRSGGIGGRRRFADLTGAGGFPDGLTVDADGYVWVALYAGGALHRYAPSGELDAVVTLPVSYPTSCAFGGDGLRELFVTTARRDLPESRLAEQPLAGRLLRLVPGVAGQRAACAEAVITAG